MNISGIYVLIDLQSWESAIDSLRQLPGVDLHQSDASSGRLVLTQDVGSTDSQMAGLEQIKRIRGVRLAEPVYHYVEDGDAPDPGAVR